MIHFVIGTRAQLFKMAPIMLECDRQKLKWRWVYTAQHKETIQSSLDAFGLPKPDYTVMKWATEAKTIGSMGKWLAHVLPALLKGRRILGEFTGKQNVVLTHGDTFTTWWGALLGRLNGCRVMHVEAGLRSFNVFKPFPEEINRLITFRLANFYACPGDWACGNLKKYKGDKVNTGMNTQIEALQYGLARCEKADFAVPKGKYAIISVHRYENIFDRDQFAKIIELIEVIAKKVPAIMVLHPATEVQMDKLGFRARLQSIKDLKMIGRLDYLPFLKAIKHAEFVATDGGGNQEELYFLGKPTLLLRGETERQEGLGETTVLSEYKPETVERFVNEYEQYRRPAVKLEVSPSKMIVDFLKQRGYGQA